MERIRLNTLLMEQLFEAAAVPMLETLAEAGIAQSTLWGWIDAEKSGVGKRMRQGGLPVLALINLCNAMRVPVRKLFVEEGEKDTVPSRSDLVSPRSQYIPCRFDMGVFRKSFGVRSEAKMTVTSMLEKLGVSYTVYVAWIADAKNLELEQVYDELEAIVGAGTKINIDYYIRMIIDEDKVDDIYEYFKEEATSDSVNEAMKALGPDYTEEEVRLIRIKFLSELGN